MKTGLVSVKLGIVAFFIPFMFAYQPALMLQGDFMTVSQALATSIVGVILLSGGMQGYFLTRCYMWERIALIAGGLLLIDSGGLTDVVGIGLSALVILCQVIRRKKVTPATV